MAELLDLLNMLVESSPQGLQAKQVREYARQLLSAVLQGPLVVCQLILRRRAAVLERVYSHDGGRFFVKFCVFIAREEFLYREFQTFLVSDSVQRSNINFFPTT